MPRTACGCYGWYNELHVLGDASGERTLLLEVTRSQHKLFALEVGPAERTIQNKLRR